MDIGQIATAMVTPFTSSGEIDFEKTSDMIEHLIANGTDTIVVCGTTGESPTLSAEEDRELIDFTVKQVNKRVPVIAGTGTNDTAVSTQLTKQADSLGVDGIMLVTPYYNKPDQRGLFAHFSYLANETDLPILLYNIPGRSIVNMEVETVVALSKVKNIRAVKEASGNLDQMARIIAQTDDDFALYSGDDGLTLPVLAIGGNGVVSVSSHIVGNEMQKMIKAFHNGHTKEAGNMHRALLPVFHALFAAPSPVPLKYALEQIGVPAGGVRLPLVAYDGPNEQFDRAWKDLQANQSIFEL